MLDQNRDKDLARNHILAIVLMTVLVIIWTIFFLPSGPPPQRETAPAPAEETAEAPRADVPGATPLDPVDTIWPDLPPPADHIAAGEEVALSNGHLELVFTNVGARLKRATVLLGREGIDSIQLVPDKPDLSDAEAIYPLGLRFSEAFLGDALDTRVWRHERAPDGRSVRFHIDLPERARIEKTFAISDTPHLIDVHVRYENLEERPRLLGLDQREPAYSLNWGPNVSSEDEDKWLVQELVWRREGQNETKATSGLAPPRAGSRYSHRVFEPDWLAVKSAYFLVAFRPEFEGAEGWALGNPNVFRFGLGAPRAELAPGEAIEHDFKIYVGPMQMGYLAQAWPELDTALEFFTWPAIMDWFAKLLLAMLNWFYGIIPNYGVGIVLLTVVVRVVMLPLTLKSMKSMKKMQKLAPELEAIRNEHKDNAQELNKKMMELYRERGVNPVGGCLPLLLQMPIFFALYRMLWNAFELRRAPFLGWINDLSEPDALFMLPFEIPMPFVAPVNSFNLLPLLMGVAMFASVKLMPTAGPVQNPQQKMIMTMMPILITVVCFNMAAGLNLYILTSTLLGIGQNYLVHVSDADMAPKKKKKATAKPTRKPHFYKVAQQKKREMAREQRRAKASKKKRD